MTLDVDEWELTSGPQAAWSRAMAEQLAARELLAELDALVRDEGLEPPEPPPRATLSDDDDVWEVDASDADRLRDANPKGAVFEWCQKRRPPIARPRFEVRKAPGGGVYVRATLLTLHLASPWFRAARRQTAEQAAAEALLPLLPDELPEQGGGQLDPRSALNELRQKGAIADYAFDVAPGPGSPQARFTAVGRMTLLGGRVYATASMEGASKKEATLLAAQALLEHVPATP